MGLARDADDAVGASVSTASFRASSLRPVMQTLSPRATSALAMPYPMPRLAPVTSAALPENAGSGLSCAVMSVTSGVS